MKKLYIQILTVVIFIGTSMSGFGQINRELIKLDKGEFIILDDTEIISKGINPPCDCIGCCEIPNFRFTDPSLAALRNHEASQLAAAAEFHAWVNMQYNLMEQEIERQLGQDFSNFGEAQNTFFKSFEIPNVKIGSQSLSPKYNSKVNVKQGIRALCLTAIKKLDLRANEIRLGNINNSQYGNLRYKSTPLNEITSLSQLNTFRAQEVNEFSDNQWRLDQELGIQNQLNNELSNLKNTNHDILNRLSDIQKSYFGQAGNYFDKLDHMQQYLVANIFYFNGPVLPPWNKVHRFGTRDYIEPYVWEKKPAHSCIFHEDFWNLRIQSQPWNIEYWLRRKEMARAKALAQALNEVSSEDILADGAIAGLGSTNEDFIKAKPGLYNEISKYFKVNDFSQVSSDCVNYLLNQYHNGNDFAANTNLYKSANTPLYQNAQNPNRALEWKPGTQAINKGFTNFGNLLSSLFENYPNSAYEGYIIRNMFGVNGLNVNASIQNEWLGSGFYFKKNNGGSVVIDFNGLDILNYGISTNNYLTNLIADLDGALNLVNEIKGYLFVNPAIAAEYKSFRDENSSSTNSKILLNELSKVISEDCYGYIPSYSLAGLRLRAYYQNEKTRLKEIHPDWSDNKISRTVALEMFQTGLDIVGLIPVVGEVADLANGVIYLVNGDNVNAGLSFAGTIPFAGWGATGAKLAIKVTTITGKTTKIALPFVFKAGGKIGFGGRVLLREVLGITDKAFEAHHIIPWTKFKDSRLVQAAANAGFHMNSKFNGVDLKKFRKSAAEGAKGLHGNHPKYDDFVNFRIENYLKGKGGALAPEDAKRFLETQLIPELEGWIKKLKVTMVI